MLILCQSFSIFAFKLRSFSNLAWRLQYEMKRKISEVTLDTADSILKDSLQKKGFVIEYLAPTSWITVIKGIIPPEGQEFEDMWATHPTGFRTLKIHGREVEIPRYQQAYGKSYKFSGNVAVAVENTPLINQIQERLNQLISVDDDPENNRNLFKLNSCLCNWYEPDHYIGPHSDVKNQLVPRSPIVGLSWGATRTFTLTSKSKEASPEMVIKKRIPVESGDVIIMGGDCQDTHKHEIEKLKKADVRGNRIAFTFRCFKS